MSKEKLIKFMQANISGELVQYKREGDHFWGNCEKRHKFDDSNEYRLFSDAPHRPFNQEEILDLIKKGTSFRKKVGGYINRIYAITHDEILIWESTSEPTHYTPDEFLKAYIYETTGKPAGVLIEN